MKPRFQCTDCGAELAWGAENCPRCGKPVDWPSEEEVASESTGPKACPKCGTENVAGASFCSSCGAKLHSGGKQVAKQQGKGPRARKQELSREAKGKKSEPLFSWKVIAGFVGLLVVLVVVLELFFNNRQPAPAQPTQAVTQAAPAAKMEFVAQITNLEQQLAANPSDTQSLLKLANMCQDGRFFDKAITYYKRYLVKNPKDANARVDLGISYFENNDLDQAQKEMETALKYDPKHLQATFNLGIVNLKARRMKEASDWFKKTIELAPAGSEISNQAKQFLEQHTSPLIQNK